MSTNDAGDWLFIGAGNMGSAIATGGVRAGVLRREGLAAVDPNASVAVGGGGEAFGSVFTDAGDAARWLESRGPGSGVMLAVKPQVFGGLGGVAETWGERLGGRLVVSMLAGTTVATIAAGLRDARVVRVMPNTPIRLGLGMTAVTGGGGGGGNATAADVDRVESLFGALGKVVRIDEGLMDAFTALAGSGPAYVFYLAEAMAHAAEQLGFDREQALTIVRQTMCGAGELLNHAPESPRALRAAVTSKGGTTQAATTVFDESGVFDAVVRAVLAARHRGAELGR